MLELRDSEKLVDAPGARVVLPPMLSWTAGVMISDMADMKTWVKDYVTGTTNSAAMQRERLDCGPTAQLRFCW